MREKGKKTARLQAVRKLKRKVIVGKIARAVLLTVGAAGLLATAIMAPNAVQGIFGDKGNKQKRWYMRKVLIELENKRLIKQERHGNKIKYQLTDKGQDCLADIELGGYQIPKQFVWDGRWRLVIFDIKESMRHAREELRDTLVTLGFEKLQNSVWVHPYPCAEVISIIKHKYNLSREILYAEIDTLENDQWLRDVFFLN
ncbi:MAG TPA: CRISPR-associated endonuclease Cas2 [Candidatus Paceibacterota bacterium]